MPQDTQTVAGVEISTKYPEPHILHLRDRVYVLRHKTGEYICLLRDDVDHIAAFSEPDTAAEFQSKHKLESVTDLRARRAGDLPFTHFWWDGQIIEFVGKQ